MVILKNQLLIRITAFLLLSGILLDFGSECYVPYEMQSSIDFQAIKVGKPSSSSVGHFLISQLNEGESEYHRNSLNATDIQISDVSVLLKNQLSLRAYRAEVRSSDLFPHTSIILLEHRLII